MNGEYSIPLVILSIVISCCASYTALFMNQRIQQNSFFHKSFWLLMSSIAMGLGIWSMHFVGMSAFMLPITMKYDPFLTVISAFPAVFASYLAFYFANRPSVSHWSRAVAAFSMGLGISSMHYIGMAAMKMEAGYKYRPWIFLASVLIAIVVSYVALFVFSALQKYMAHQLIKLLTSIPMGLAITSMHYTGMSAVVFYTETPLHSNLHQMQQMDITLLTTVVVTGVSLLLLISGLTSLLDRYVDHRLHFFDALTLLPNQRKFEQDLNSVKSARSLAIVHIHNVEKWISMHGYTFGDTIIQAVGEVIQSMKSASAQIYRIEENRFAVVEAQDSEETLNKAMERTLALLKKPLHIHNHRLAVEMVCAVSHSNGKEKRELLSNAMAVLQHPSIQYNHEIIEYNPEIHTYSYERQIVQDIGNAIAGNELFLVYQPKVSSKSLKPAGVEALLRWQHPRFGQISPGIFIPILEENGKIFDVTDWVIEEACRQISEWRKESVDIGHVSINIPGSYVTSSRLLNVIHDNLSAYRIETRCIELEITETSVIEDIENAIIAIARFRELGLSVALDDFGTGLSSLSYLKRMPISTIKIDKSFVDGVPISDKDSAVLNAIITLCYSLNLNVVIEGVETEGQMEFITSMTEAPLIQGYYFSRPLMTDELVAWFAKRAALNKAAEAKRGEQRDR
ncbi:EAL domain-containing protein [Paenibacillus sp. CGMCC 1.18879]|uniref:bifunctional diguanylate cyclase/phosphodiesterase n=2 Tax=Paenibacillus TaxID=44249 RepID=UPI00292FFB30|nr:EAL domain-containing protein [Paenibacillus sp. CGMCC 1.18879]